MEKFTECVVFEAIPADRIDREAGVIREIRVLGEHSRNNRRYPPETQKKATGLYESCPVKLNHRQIKGVDRKVQEGFGELRNVLVRDNATWADHHFPPSHPYAPVYCDYVEHFPRQIGFSHDAEGECKMVDGVQVVESLAAVHSVDIVDAPATNQGLFESEQRQMAANKKTRTVKEIVEAAQESPERQQLLENMDAGIIAPDLEVPAGEEGETDQDSLKAALASAVMAVFNDDTMDAKETKKAIAKIIDMGEVVAGGGKKDGEESDEESDEEDVPAFESLQREIKDLRAENDVRRMIESYTIDVDEDLVESLKMLNDKQRKALLERLTAKAKTTAARPVRSASLKESRGNPSNSQFDTALERVRARKSTA